MTTIIGRNRSGPFAPDSILALDSLESKMFGDILQDDPLLSEREDICEAPITVEQVDKHG